MVNGAPPGVPTCPHVDVVVGSLLHNFEVCNLIVIGLKNLIINIYIYLYFQQTILLYLYNQNVLKKEGVDFVNLHHYE